MYHIYCTKYRITQNPVSYNHILAYLFRWAKLDWNRLSELRYDEQYTYGDYTFVRAV